MGRRVGILQLFVWARETVVFLRRLTGCDSCLTGSPLSDLYSVVSLHLHNRSITTASSHNAVTTNIAPLQRSVNIQTSHVHFHRSLPVAAMKRRQGNDPSSPSRAISPPPVNSKRIRFLAPTSSTSSVPASSSSSSGISHLPLDAPPIVSAVVAAPVTIRVSLGLLAMVFCLVS
jgi:hypothetical protein